MSWFRINNWREIAAFASSLEYWSINCAISASDLIISVYSIMKLVELELLVERLILLFPVNQGVAEEDAICSLV
jgi:hypothetical protein